MARCRDCQFFGPIEPDKDGRVRVRRDYAYPCSFPMEKLIYPDSVPEAARPTTTGRVEPDGGARCRRFVKREDV